MIKNKEANMQFIDYSGLAYDREYHADPHGVYHPMDIDGMYHFSKKSHPEMKYNQAVLFYEFKRDKAQMNKGQEYCYKALVDTFAKNGDLAACFVVSHQDDYRDGDINGADGIVTKVYFKGKWQEPTKELTAKEFTDLFMREAGLMNDSEGKEED